MKLDYVPALPPRELSTLRCGHRDCRYYCPETDSCDYILLEYRRRGCPPTPDCARFLPARRGPAAEGPAADWRRERAARQRRRAYLNRLGRRNFEKMRNGT